MTQYDQVHFTPSGRTVSVLIDGEPEFVPCSEDNEHWRAISALVDSGALTIADAPGIDLGDWAERPLEDIQGMCNGLLVAALEIRMEALVSGNYGPHERETWRKQEAEARAFTDDPEAPTPYLDGLRLDGETRAEQVAAVMAKVDQIEAATQALLLRKRELLASLYACEDAAEIAAWLSDELPTGWPAAE